MYLYYVLLIIICILVLLFIWFKIRYSFWSKQPVFNYYNIYYWMYPNRIINNYLPEMNKYYNVRNIVFKNYTDVTHSEKIEIMSLLQTHYYKEKHIHYRPLNSNVFPYFENQVDNSYISLFYKNKKVVGVFSGRPLTVTLNGLSFITYYADFLCVHNEHRKKNIGPELIQTHYYNQSYKQPSILTSLFKKESNLNHFVPLIVYNTYTFNMKNWITYQLHSSVNIINITSKNIHILVDFIRSNKHKYKCFITCSIANLLNLIKTGNVYVYCVIINGKVYASYFFRNTSTSYFNKKSIECFGSIQNCSDLLFIYAFSNIAYFFKPNFLFITIENISNSSTIIENIVKKHKYIFETKTAFYFYNYATYPLKKEEFLCIY